MRCSGRCSAIARQALTGALVDPTRALDHQKPPLGATHYHVTDMADPPLWRLAGRRLGEIGHHTFYCDVD